MWLEIVHSGTTWNFSFIICIIVFKLYVWSVGNSVTAPEQSNGQNVLYSENLWKGMEEMLELVWDKEMEFYKALFWHLVWRAKQTYKWSISSPGQWLRVKLDTSQVQIR